MSITKTDKTFSMKYIFFLLLLTGWICFSCSHAQDDKEKDKKTVISLEDSIKSRFSFNGNEDAAFDALDKIQVNGGNLYSTFPNLQHNFGAPIDTFTISSEVFETALLGLLHQFYPDFSPEERSNLASQAAAARKEYCVTTYGSNDLISNHDTITPPQEGTWIFHAFCDQRDLIIRW